MDVIQEKLFLYCRSENKDECIITLKDKLKKINQVDEYDLIYNNFVDITPFEEYTYLSLIENLNRPIHLMIFCQIYRHLLFPEHFNEFTPITEERMEWILSLFDRQYGVLSFIFISYQLVNIYGKSFKDGETIFFNRKREDHFSPENRQTLIDLTIDFSPFIEFFGYDFFGNRFSFPYILLGNASNLSFESMTTLLVCDERFTKIPVGFKFYIDDNTNGPHGNYYNTPETFFEHDLEHFTTTLNNIRDYNINDIWRQMKIIRVGTAFRKVMDVYIFMYIFEHFDRTTEINRNVFDDFEKKLLKVIDKLDDSDHGYLFKYLMSANDINDNILIGRYFEYQGQYNVSRAKLIDIRNEYSKVLRESDYVRVNELEIEDRDVSNYIKELSKELLELYLTRLNII